MQAVKPAGRRRIRVGYFLTTALLLVSTLPSSRIHAQSKESLQACLSAFDSVIWSLPYSPRLTAGNCHNNGSTADIEFFMHEVLEADARGLEYDNRYAAEKKAVFAFFEQLFRRHGYQLESTEADSDARVPYVKQAVFRRQNGDSVEYMASSNVCRLKLKKAGTP